MNETCESCGMPMTGPADHAPGHPDSAYCRMCSDAAGDLQEFDERFERMVQWQMRHGRERGLSRAEAEPATRAYMRTMPLWKDHPRLQEG